MHSQKFRSHCASRCWWWPRAAAARRTPAERPGQPAPRARGRQGHRRDPGPRDRRRQGDHRHHRQVPAERHDLRVGDDRRLRAERHAAREVDVRRRPDGRRIPRTIAPNTRERTEFHISKPDGWPAGKYKVEVFLNDQSAGTKNFEVQAR